MTADQPENQSTLHAIVSGRVQGVGFRMFTAGKARRLPITGMVRNLPNGNVEVKARGARPDLDTLLGYLHKGPNFSRVDNVECQWDVEMGEYTEFRVER